MEQYIPLSLKCEPSRIFFRKSIGIRLYVKVQLLLIIADELRFNTSGSTHFGRNFDVLSQSITLRLFWTQFEYGVNTH